jgi:hypothetical protein
MYTFHGILLEQLNKGHFNWFGGDGQLYRMFVGKLEG